MTSFEAQQVHIQQIYDRFWREARAPLARGEVQPDPIPGMESLRWGVSVIMRLRGEVAERLVGVIDELSRWTGRRHLRYQASNLHTTLQTIELYRPSIDAEDEYIQQYRRVLRQVAAQFPPLQIRYQGLTANQMSVMAQGWPVDETLRQLRETFHTRVRAEKHLPGPGIRDLAHASLIVFAGPLLDPTGCVSFVESQRQSDFGTATIDRLELVQYQRTSVYEAWPIVLDSVPLQG
ncbi:hypothetical protein [Dictyobacter aurantiacus]|uniref:Uncharacterized protein n=1 Tax=Dictyobacter aurantiacus TaxID=1936993 RepID=A0A401ZMR7_9CHLR|nr:hypothetical protein [Dictyobacter aurantiacus]GCE08167.1 hypothetical protein KDAU_54960 [Dictyobacter aurantiacus]